MREHTSWSINLGRYRGIYVQVHMFFLLFAAISLYLSWLEQNRAGEGLVAVTAGSLGLLLISVVLHELGHVWAAHHRGGAVSEITLGPLGGLSGFEPPLLPRDELAVHLAGPLVNLTICLISAVLLHLWQPFGWSGLLHPLRPVDLLVGSSFVVTLKLLVWINWILLVANLFPAYPFDGARALRAGLLCLEPRLPRRRAARRVASFAKVTAVVLAFTAGVLWQAEQGPALIAPWFALLTLAIFLYFSAKQEELRSLKAPTPRPQHRAAPPSIEELAQMESFGDQSFSKQAFSENASAEGTLLDDSDWLEVQRRRLVERREQIEADEESQVDEILVRVHEHGMTSLSEDDRRLLERVSARYRKRQQNAQ